MEETWCRECNLIYESKDLPEEIRIDYQISKVDIPPSIHFQSKTTIDKIALDNSREELNKKYGKRDFIEDDTRSLLTRARVRIIDQWEH